jgi:hypothetical protein
MKRLTVELSFNKYGQPIWPSIRIVELKAVKRRLKTRARERKLLHHKSWKAARAARVIVRRGCRSMRPSSLSGLVV